MRLRVFVVVCGAVAVAGIPVGPAGATHAYRCDASEERPIREAMCAPHQLWDSVTGGRPADAVCVLGRAVGVDNVKECEPTR